MEPEHEVVSAIISPYPRYGEPLAPHALARVLAKFRLPSHLVPPSLLGKTYSDLDESVWNVSHRNQLDELAARLATLLSHELPKDQAILAMPLPLERLGSGRVLHLSQRTRNALVRAGFLDAEALAGRTIRDVMQVRGFGWTCLLDLLVALETASYVEASTPQQFLIRPYPRIGERIVPEVLRPYVRSEVTLNGVTRKIIDFDVLELAGLDDEVRRRMAALAECDVRVQSAEILSREGNRVLYCGRSLEVREIGVSLRTYNCLSKSRMLSLEALSQSTVSDFWLVRGVGAATLLDLLVALETAESRKPPDVVTADGIQATDDGRIARFEEEALVLATTPHADRLLSCDPRLGSPVRQFAVSVGSRESVNSVLELCQLVRRGGGRIVPASLECLMSLNAAISHARALTVEEEVTEIVSAVSRSERDASVLCMRLGLHELGPQTLEQVGDAFGVTRERIRQIQSRTQARLGKCASVYTPALAQALQLLSDASPIDSSSASKLLVEQNVCAGEVSPAGVIEAGEWFGLPHDLQVLRLDANRSLVLAADEAELADRIRSMAARQMSRQGWGILDDVVLAAVEKSTRAEEPEYLLRLRQAAISVLDPIWLDEPNGVFTLRLGRGYNRLAYSLRQVFSVAQELRADELKVALSRQNRSNGKVPASKSLLEFARLLSFIEVDGETLRPACKIDAEEVLGENLASLVEIFREAGGLMTFSEALEEGHERGLNDTTMLIYMMDRPVFTRFASGVYGLVGSRPDPGLVDAKVEQLRRSEERTHVTSEWLADGRIRLTYRMTKTLRRSGVVGIPASVRSFVEGRLEVRDAEGTRLGNLTVRDYSGWGLGPAFRALASQGDTVALVIDPSSRICEVTVSSEARQA